MNKIENSAFKKYETLIFDGHSKAIGLRKMVMNLYSNENNVDMSFISGTNEKLFDVVIELLRSYRLNGESDPYFMDICKRLYQRQKDWDFEKDFESEEVVQKKRPGY